MASKRKILISKDGSSFYVKDASKDFHTEFGYVKAEDLARKDGSKVITNTGREFAVFSSSFADDYKKIKRAPQIIPLKDVGAIVSETGLGKKSKVVDAGTGSGALAFFLANITKQVASYEIRQDFFEIAIKNKEFLGIKNLTLKNKDVTLGIDEKNIDLVTLDLPAPWEAVKHAANALKAGGFLVSYSPTIPQVMDFIAEIKKNNLAHMKTIEIIEREWDVDERKVRPKSQAIGHSGFLSFCRKIG